MLSPRAIWNFVVNLASLKMQGRKLRPSQVIGIWQHTHSRIDFIGSLSRSALVLTRDFYVGVAPSCRIRDFIARPGDAGAPA
jgi:hypothetical protein